MLVDLICLEGLAMSELGISKKYIVFFRFSLRCIPFSYISYYLKLCLLNALMLLMISSAAFGFFLPGLHFLGEEFKPLSGVPATSLSGFKGLGYIIAYQNVRL